MKDSDWIIERQGRSWTKENLGADRIVRLGDPEIWREAVKALPPS
jgi:hypothetical protein